MLIPGIVDGLRTHDHGDASLGATDGAGRSRSPTCRDYALLVPVAQRAALRDQLSDLGGDVGA